MKKIVFFFLVSFSSCFIQPQNYRIVQENSLSMEIPFDLTNAQVHVSPNGGQVAIIKNGQLSFFLPDFEQEKQIVTLDGIFKNFMWAPAHESLFVEGRKPSYSCIRYRYNHNENEVDHYLYREFDRFRVDRKLYYFDGVKLCECQDQGGALQRATDDIERLDEPPYDRQGKPRWISVAQQNARGVAKQLHDPRAHNEYNNRYFFWDSSIGGWHEKHFGQLDRTIQAENAFKKYSRDLFPVPPAESPSSFCSLLNNADNLIECRLPQSYTQALGTRDGKILFGDQEVFDVGPENGPVRSMAFFASVDSQETASRRSSIAGLVAAAVIGSYFYRTHNKLINPGRLMDFNGEYTSLIEAHKDVPLFSAGKDEPGYNFQPQRRQNLGNQNSRRSNAHSQRQPTSRASSTAWRFVQALRERLCRHKMVFGLGAASALYVYKFGFTATPLTKIFSQNPPSFNIWRP